MIIIHQPRRLLELISACKKNGRVAGFVPTMGALHAGHIALIEASGKETDITICSIFVNPTQFNDPGDYGKYPKTIENDIRLLERTGNDILFLPPVSAIYAEGTDNLEHYDLGYLESILEGEYRPGHFQGVCQVMSRLLNAVQPHKLFMGRKDYQQCMVMQRLIDQRDLPVQLVTCETVREPDGLAMSSRNLRLTPEQRQLAPAVYKTLLQTKQQLKQGPLGDLKDAAKHHLERSGFRVDYFEIAGAHDLALLNHWDGSTPVVALVAAFLGDVRLIDNLALSV